jgi:hypothetical protein
MKGSILKLLLVLFHNLYDWEALAMPNLAFKVLSPLLPYQFPHYIYGIGKGTVFGSDRQGFFA